MTSTNTTPIKHMHHRLTFETIPEEDDDEDMSLASPHHNTAAAAACLFFDSETTTTTKKKQQEQHTSSKMNTTRSHQQHQHHCRMSSSSSSSHQSDPESASSSSSALRQLDMNNNNTTSSTTTTNSRRKRGHDGDGEPYGRQDMMQDDDDDMLMMFQSPRPSPPPTSSSSYLTMDGRTVTSKNPFSPYHTPAADNSSMEVEDDTNTMQTTAPTFPADDDFGGQPLLFLPSANNNKLLLLPQRDVVVSSSTSTSSSNKARRMTRMDDAATSTTEQQQKTKTTKLLYVDTANNNNDDDDISPTDVMSFPTSTTKNIMPPPTPIKAPRTTTNTSSSVVNNNNYTPVRKSHHPPETPMPERRRSVARMIMNSSSEEDGTISMVNNNKHQTSPSNNNNHTTSRFRSDFDIIGELGHGSFGTVYKVLSQLDGCMYAVKVAKRKFKGHADKDRMLKEVYALAALSDQSETATFHIVRYHQAWLEDNRLYIQTELCASTLQEEMAHPFNVNRRYKLLREMLLALEFLHRNNMVHLDLKPENIMIKNDQFKLGDFGLVSKTTNGGDDVEEGDSRYMSMELLSGDHKDLTKSDIFSLGATMYEICLGRPLPMDGQEWQDIRAGALQSLQGTTPYELEVIIKQMMHPDPDKRPSAAELLKRRPLLSEEQKQLMDEKDKVLQAKMTLAWQTQQLNKLTPPPPGGLKRASTWNGGF